MGKTLYDFLGVDAKVSQEEIDAAFQLKKANLGEEAGDTIKFLNEAYYVIGDPARRTSYDQDLLLKENPHLYITEQKEQSHNSMRLFGSALLLLVALGGWRYMDNQRELERARLEQEARVAEEMKELEQQKLAQVQAEQERRAELQKIQMQQYTNTSFENELRTEERLRHQQETQLQREEERRRANEERQQRLEADRVARERETERRAAELRARQEKAELERIYRENYGARR